MKMQRGVCHGSLRPSFCRACQHQIIRHRRHKPLVARLAPSKPGSAASNVVASSANHISTATLGALPMTTRLRGRSGGENRESLNGGKSSNSAADKCATIGACGHTWNLPHNGALGPLHTAQWSSKNDFTQSFDWRGHGRGRPGLLFRERISRHSLHGQRLLAYP